MLCRHLPEVGVGVGGMRRTSSLAAFSSSSGVSKGSCCSCSANPIRGCRSPRTRARHRRSRNPPLAGCRSLRRGVAAWQGLRCAATRSTRAPSCGARARRVPRWPAAASPSASRGLAPAARSRRRRRRRSRRRSRRCWRRGGTATWLDAEPLCDLAHADRRDAPLVGDGYRCLDHTLPAERRVGRRRSGHPDLFLQQTS